MFINIWSLFLSERRRVYYASVHIKIDLIFRSRTNMWSLSLCKRRVVNCIQ